MEVTHRIQQMLLNGREREARELYFAELAPLLNEFHDALDDLLDRSRTSDLRIYIRDPSRAV